MKRRFLTIPALIAFLICTSIGQQQRPNQNAPNPAIAIQKDVMIPMRDGVKLACDIYLPAKDGVTIPGRYPTILSRTPYDKNAEAREALYWASRGYAVVWND